MPSMKPDGTCRWEVFLFEDGIVDAVESTPDLLQGMSKCLRSRQMSCCTRLRSFIQH